MIDVAQRRFTGAGQPQQPRLEGAWPTPEPYVVSPELRDAVNMALYLRRPLLLEGEPGSGKTRLAYAIAYELGFPLKEIYIRSTSRAQDLLYTFDAVRRLYDIQERSARHLRQADVGDGRDTSAANTTDGSDELADKRKYIKLGALGEAIELGQRDIPSVVLIDEIDKADIDFPNDLLLVLDRLQFRIDEVPSWTVDALQGQDRAERAHALPLVIVTSNREKELPAPFLRRCLFYYIEFPNENELNNIVERHFGTKMTGLFNHALSKFWQMRETKAFQWRKRPSTSEFLDWLSILRRDEQQGLLNADEFAKISSLAQLPHLEALLKTQSDRVALIKTFGTLNTVTTTGV